MAHFSLRRCALLSTVVFVCYRVMIHAIIYQLQGEDNHVNRYKVQGDVFQNDNSAVEAMHNGRKPPDDHLSDRNEIGNDAKSVENMLRNRARNFQSSEVNCAAMIDNDAAEIKAAYHMMKVERRKLKSQRRASQKSAADTDHAQHVFSDLDKRSHVLENTNDCPDFIKSHGFVEHHLTEEERDFPLAFSMLVYRDVEMVVRLLSAVYRPQVRTS